MPELLDCRPGHWRELPDARLKYCPEFYTSTQAAALFVQLQGEIQWSQPQVRLFGKTHKVPRLTAFYGDRGLQYSYSGVRHETLPWSATLQQIKRDVERSTQRKFNSVLLNCYRNGSDSNGWHADDEKELGDAPFIASLSLGASRDFHFRHNKLGKHNYSCALESGSLLLMAGCMQQHWQHQLPKRLKVSDARINLTFRLVERN
ncbi:MAG: alpha-ketoglutarate-dependent dioxygenase AlkB [Gammaproteobacteria bacterium]|nr:alpha-ketoglutarate-dependent dioxygenase AlkB [Gammaproteobacteria bacterium]MBT8150673.1 alpha-ketoglutarate-dependent dioxygenase AlkB [Gammaproteobacteria bacterium]NND38614.1 alpha-ketoglutarate-dependent dioxygenase AlkB [Pseudomonadales bacterium]NNL10694.1 alpha-ketoglutarate-dependent dioxygenase AlkB [Pseudomonadales bacterium]NNM11337.1 alpha-ketoglutarate-dependent dioxygenase AlkB [Pseudomonadales bacterium]